MASALAEFFYKINYQESRLTSDSFMKYIFTDLQSGEMPDIDLDETCEYELALPMEFHRFLPDCNNILNAADIENPDFSCINVEYLISLIYCGLCSEDSADESDSIPVQAANLFFTLCSSKYADAFIIEEIVFNMVLLRILQALEERALVDRKLSTMFVENWNNFLATNVKPYDIERMAEVLAVSLATNTTTLIDSFRLGTELNLYTNTNIKCEILEDDDTWCNTSKSIFICLKTIIEVTPSHNIKHVVSAISLKLLKHSNKEILCPNVIRFFKKVLHKFCNDKWYLLMLPMALREIKRKETFIQIINYLPVERHKVMVNIILNNYVQAESEEDIKMYLTILNLLIEYPYQDQPDDRRLKLVQRILTETYFRSSSKSYVLREFVMELFINWSQMKDLYVRQHLQQMFKTHNKVQTARLFEMLLQGVDISWKTPDYNVTFIIFTCRMFLLNQIFITQYRMRILEMLCYKAAAHYLKPCVPTLVELIRRFALTPHPVLKPVLTALVSNALSATPSSNYYMKVIFDLLANCMVAANDSIIDYALCEVILADDFKCVELFKTLQIHNFIRAEHMRVLIEEKILKYAGSWKLLTILLDNMECRYFPPYMEHYLTRMNQPGFYVKPESVYMLQVLTKVFTFKLKAKSVSLVDKKLANSIQGYITKAIRDMLIPAKHVNDTLILFLTLNRVTDSDLGWIKTFFQEMLTHVLKQDVLLVRFPLMRHIMYLEQFLMLFDCGLDENQIKRLMEMMEPDNQDCLMNYEQTYTRLVSFFGKVCFKYPTYIKDAIPLFQHAMIQGPNAVQLLAMSALYDLSNLVLIQYDALYPSLLKLIKDEDNDVKNMAVKILIKLVNDNHIKLTCGDFITLMLILVDRNYKLCLYFIDILESDFIHRNQQTISKYFINLMFYLNKYQNHASYPIPPRDISLGNQDFTYERRIIIYKFLFCNLERQSQLQILNALNEDFLELFYKGRIEPTSSILNILRDILTLISFNASEYMTDHHVTETDVFYNTLFDDMKRDFFRRKRSAEPSTMEFDKMLENILVSVLRMLYKIEKSNISMLPQFLSTIGLATRAFYNKVVLMVQENSQLKELYYELENCYLKYKEMVKREPLNLLDYCDKEEWRLYLGSQILIS